MYSKEGLLEGVHILGGGLDVFFGLQVDGPLTGEGEKGCLNKRSLRYISRLKFPQNVNRAMPFRYSQVIWHVVL